MLAILRFVSLLLGALNLGLAFAHVVEMRPKRAMSGPEWLTTQQAYRDFGRAAGVTFPALLLSTLATLVLVRERSPIALLTAFGAGATATTVAIWARFNQPVNRRDRFVAGRRSPAELGGATRPVGVRARGKRCLPRRESGNPYCSGALGQTCLRI